MSYSVLYPYSTLLFGFNLVANAVYVDHDLEAHSIQGHDLSHEVTALIPSSCYHLSDGYHYMKLMEDTETVTYPIVHALCNDGYMIIDVDHDPNFKQYFSSFDTWHYALGGSSANDHANWEQWWLPNSGFVKEGHVDEVDYWKYIVSPTCDECDISKNYADSLQRYSFQDNADTYGDRTGYYMTGTMFGCLHYNKAWKDCIWDYDTYECGLCTKKTLSDGDLGFHIMYEGQTSELDQYQKLFDGEDEDDQSWSDLTISLCGVYPQSTYNDAVPQTRADCFEFLPNIKPSIGTDGRHCVCVSPNADDVDQYVKVKYADLTAVQTTFTTVKVVEMIASNDGSSEDTEEENAVVELYQRDFMSGTYRIREAGTYRIMEDIEFDFNAGDWNHPNAVESWWPRKDQRSEYKGAQTNRDEYAFGFFAGITVETDDVVIDLNGFELRQSKAFYYQQRQFSCIDLKSVVFALNNGPGVFGTNPVYANNVIVKDGSIGLSSHFGIHGQNNDNVLIENVHIHGFETHGIEMSYFSNLKIRNVEIGPSSTIAYLKGEYGHARWTLQKIQNLDTQYLVADLDEWSMHFEGRSEPQTFTEIAANLQTSMDVAFKHIMGVETYAEDDELFISAKKLFVNEDGLPYGAVMYGLFLNLWISNVFTIHPSLHHSHNALIENLYIHDLEHSTIEYVRLEKYGYAPYKNPYFAAISAEAVLGDQILPGYDDIDWENAVYVGDVLLDSHIALDKVTDDWAVKGLMFMDEDFHNWVIDEFEWTNDDDSGHPWTGCNGDRMMHVNKGIMAIRMDGTENIVFKDITIEGIRERSPMPKTLCGEYWAAINLNIKGGGHFLQDAPYCYGYTGNMIHGIYADWATITLMGDIKMTDFYSDTGLVRGLGLYTNTLVNIDSSQNTMITMANMGAGNMLYGVATEKLKAPYAPSSVKPIHIVFFNYMGNSFSTYVKVDNVDTTENQEGYMLKDYVDMKCFFGRDDVDMSDLKSVNDLDVDMSACDDFPYMSNIESSDKVTTSASNGWFLNNMWMFVVILVCSSMMFLFYKCIRNNNKIMKNEYAHLLEHVPSKSEQYGT